MRIKRESKQCTPSVLIYYKFVVVVVNVVIIVVIGSACSLTSHKTYKLIRSLNLFNDLEINAFRPLALQLWLHLHSVCRRQPLELLYQQIYV